MNIKSQLIEIWRFGDGGICESSCGLGDRLVSQIRSVPSGRYWSVRSPTGTKGISKGF